ncbi:hypothetical protein PT974_05877 [Cladobotryum mycophilum]|uniref:Uncharacterized protein n=1 Tax=Cladobotryum mycophilum TaxID=491253 RepID=A0ABR0SJZ7_9HYPO
MRFLREARSCDFQSSEDTSVAESSGESIQITSTGPYPIYSTTYWSQRGDCKGLEIIRKFKFVSGQDCDCRHRHERSLSEGREREVEEFPEGQPAGQPAGELEEGLSEEELVEEIAGESARDPIIPMTNGVDTTSDGHGDSVAKRVKRSTSGSRRSCAQDSLSDRRGGQSSKASQRFELDLCLLVASVGFITSVTTCPSFIGQSKHAAKFCAGFMFVACMCGWKKLDAVERERN